MISINKLVTNSIVITTGPVVKDTTVVKYTAASGLSDWEDDIVGKIAYNTIPNLSNVEAVEIGSHVTSIGDYVFYYCDNLQSVTIQGNDMEIHPDAFYGCSKATFK